MTVTGGSLSPLRGVADLTSAVGGGLVDESAQLDFLGYNAVEKVELLFGPKAVLEIAPDAIPDAISRRGDVWTLGSHRVMCGDSCALDDVSVLMNGETAQLLHADPPYGMGKESEGVANDNLYAEHLDRFQLRWWRAFRGHIASNASCYVWGNALDLWRLWFVAGLGASERMELRNEIVWDKKVAGAGGVSLMGAEGLMYYPLATERCLFFQLGNQFVGNINADDFPATWEPLRSYLAGEADAAGIKPADIKRVCGCGMYSHWFSRSQFTLIAEAQYAKLRESYPGHFTRPWSELREEWVRVRGGPMADIRNEHRSARSYFDNTHDLMRDVWEFPRVLGAVREGHPTPKPVAMMERVMRSSLRQYELCAEPFGGSGSTLIAAQRTGRRCFTMELEPRYCDVIVGRWCRLTGETAKRQDGLRFPVYDGR